MTASGALLHVCTTCRAGQEPASQEPASGCAVPGAALHARLAALLALRPNALVTLREAKCLSNCDRGCSAAIASPGKWSYLLGGLGADQAEDLLEYAAIYAASSNGVVMPSRRPMSLRDVVHGRIPPSALG